MTRLRDDKPREAGQIILPANHHVGYVSLKTRFPFRNRPSFLPSIGPEQIPDFVTLPVSRLYGSKSSILHENRRWTTSNAIMQEICQSSGSSAYIVLPDLGTSSQSTPSPVRSAGTQCTSLSLQHPNSVCNSLFSQHDRETQRQM